MATKYLKNSDKILQAVLSDAKLAELGEYNPDDIPSIDDAQFSDNPVIKTVALLINGINTKLSEKQIYNQILDYLKGERL